MESQTSQHQSNSLLHNSVYTWLPKSSRYLASPPESPLRTTSVALHPIQSNRDIIDEIFSHLSIEDWALAISPNTNNNGPIGPENSESRTRRLIRGKLRSLALMCKAFMDPALDQLWGSLDSLFPLLKLLPAFKQSDETWTLRGTVTKDQWTRFGWYARRVRHFMYRQDPPELDIALHTYFRLAQLHPTPLFPSLRSLHCPMTSQANFLVSGMCLFICESLRTLELDMLTSVEDKLCGTVLHTFGDIGARIHKVALKGSSLSEETLRMVLRFETLGNLELQGMGQAINVAVLEEIGALHNLSILTIDLTDSVVLLTHMDGVVVRSEAGTWLRALRSLTITAPISFATTFLLYIASQRLETLIALSWSSLEASPWRPDIVELVNDVTAWKDTMIHLEIQRMSTLSLTLDNLRLDELSAEEVLMPLHSLERLRVLRFEGFMMEITDEDVGLCGLAWPELTTLLLPFGAVDPTRMSVKPTAAALVMLANSTPKLKNLRIPLETVGCRFEENEPGNERNSNLFTVTVASTDDGPWEFIDALHFARYIDYCFPNLVSLRSFRQEDAEKWVKIFDIVQMYQSVRRWAV